MAPSAMMIASRDGSTHVLMGDAIRRHLWANKFPRLDVELGDSSGSITESFTVVVTNPPYVNSDSMSRLPPEYQREPQIALAGGEDGMDLVRKIVDGAAERLTPEGILVVEIGNEREFAESAFGALGLTWLSTSQGDDAVFLLTAEQLRK